MLIVSIFRTFRTEKLQKLKSSLSKHQILLTIFPIKIFTYLIAQIKTNINIHCNQKEKLLRWQLFHIHIG